MNYLIKGGVIIDPGKIFNLKKLDIVIEDRKIKLYDKFDKDIKSLGKVKVIDAKGKYIFGNLFDIHTHLRDPGYTESEDILSGSRAAIAGGFTSVACMPNTNTVNDSLEVTKYIKNKSKEVDLCRVYPIGAITEGLHGSSLYHLGDKFCKEVVALSDDGNSVEKDNVMKIAMQIAAYYNIPIISHCEYSRLSNWGYINKGKISKKMGIPGISRKSEIKMIKRDIKLAKKTRCKLHIAHVSTKEGVKLIKRSKEDNINVTCEVTPHHLWFTENKFEYNFNTDYKMNPPLRTEEDREALIQGLIDGVIDVIASDHAPHSIKEKFKNLNKAPFGCIGLESTLPAIFSLLCRRYQMELSKVVEKMTINPHKILNIPYKGINLYGKSDLVIFDPKCLKKAEPKYSKSKNCPFKDFNLYGWPTYVFMGGELVYNLKCGFDLEAFKNDNKS